ncbi:unnamed protein product, partial [Symbiodinium sp. KB8]
MAPAGYTIFIEIPMRSGDRWRLQNFMSAAQLAPVVVSAEPFSNMTSLQLSDAQELAGFCRRYEEAGGAGCLLRYAHEMNGAWYPWCQRPSEFRSTYRMLAGAIHAITARSGMVWSVNEGSGYPFSGGTYSCQQGMSCFSEVDTNGDGVFDKFDDPYAPYYPGDDVVDWVGITVYSWGLLFPFGENQLPQDNYFVNRIRGNYVGPAGDYRSTPDFYFIYCSPQGGHNKPMMLTESSALYAVGAPFGGTASNMDIKRNWWMQVFGLTACPPSSLCGGAEFPMLKGIMWFDVIKREGAAQNATVDWSVTQNTSMAQNFAQDVLNQPGGRARYMGLDELNEMRGCADDDVEDCTETKCCEFVAATKDGLIVYDAADIDKSTDNGGNWSSGRCSDGRKLAVQASMPSAPNAFGFAWSDDGRYLASVCDEGVRIYDADKSYKKVRELEKVAPDVQGRAGGVRSLKWDPQYPENVHVWALTGDRAG